jgi:hypothetical protein
MEKINFLFALWNINFSLYFGKNDIACPIFFRKKR